MRFFILFLISFSAYGRDCQPISMEEFRGRLQDVQERYFPEFKDLSIIVTTFRSDAYFLQAQPKIKTLFKKRSQRIYEVQLNTKLLDCPPTSAGLEAILVHELEHIRDYTGWSSIRIAKHGLRYSFNCDMRIGYECATDLRVLEFGLHQGLIDYRHWVYEKLTPKELKKKEKIYLTPREIEEHRDASYIL